MNKVRVNRVRRQNLTGSLPRTYSNRMHQESKQGSEWCPSRTWTKKYPYGPDPSAQLMQGPVCTAEVRRYWHVTVDGLPVSSILEVC